MPPTPGPIAVADLLGADLGWVILFGAIAGIPAMILAGPVFGRYISHRINVAVPKTFKATSTQDQEKKIGLFPVVSIILLPLFLIMLNTAAPFCFGQEHAATNLLVFLGHPFTALLLANLAAIFILRIGCGFSKEMILQVSNKGLEPAGIVILITGAGGAFKQLLIDSGVGSALSNLIAESGMPLVLLAFTIAALTRIAQGSATVAMITAAGLMAPITETREVSAAMLGLLVIAISSGASIMSHVNDSGFWLVNRYLEISEQDTLRSWTVLTTIVALTGLAVSLAISSIIGS